MGVAVSLWVEEMSLTGNLWLGLCLPLTSFWISLPTIFLLGALKLLLRDSWSWINHCWTAKVKFKVKVMFALTGFGSQGAVTGFAHSGSSELSLGK